MLGRRVAQSMLEYVTLFAIVAAAFSVMYQFAVRSVNSKIELFENMVDTSPSESTTPGGSS